MCDAQPNNRMTLSELLGHEVNLRFLVFSQTNAFLNMNTRIKLIDGIE